MIDLCLVLLKQNCCWHFEGSWVQRFGCKKIILKRYTYLSLPFSTFSFSIFLWRGLLKAQWLHDQYTRWYRRVGGMTGNPVQYGPEVAKAKRKRKEKKEERHQQTRDVCGSKCLKDNTNYFLSIQIQCIWIGVLPQACNSRKGCTRDLLTSFLGLLQSPTFTINHSDMKWYIMIPMLWSFQFCSLN